MLQTVVTFYFRQTLFAADPGHIQVEENVVRGQTATAQYIQRFDTVVRNRTFDRTAHAFQRQSKNLLIVDVVVNQKTGN